MTNNYRTNKFKNISDTIDLIGAAIKRSRRWTEGEIDDLIRLYPSTSNAELAEYFGRSIETIKAKAYSLDLRKTSQTSKYTDGQIVTYKTGQFIKIGKKYEPLKKYIDQQIGINIDRGRGVKFKDGDSNNITVENIESVPFTEIVNEIRLAEYPDELKPAMETVFELEKLINAMSPSNVQKFTPENKAKLTELNETLNTKQLSLELGVTVNTIKTFRQKLGLKEVVKTENPNAWKEDQLNLLKKLYPTTGNHELAVLLGRSTNAIQLKAQLLGLKKNDEMLRELIENRRHDNKYFTNEEDRILIESYGLIDRKTLAKKLGRSEGSIAKRYQALRAKSVIKEKRSPKARYWTDSENQILKQLFATTKIKKIAEILNRSARSVYMRAHQMNLQKQS